MLLRTLFGQDSELVDAAKKEGGNVGSELRKVKPPRSAKKIVGFRVRSFDFAGKAW